MNMIMPGFGVVPWFPHCVAAARARSGCNVFVASDMPQYVSDSHYYTVDSVRSTMCSFVDSLHQELARWFVLPLIIKRFELKGPFVFPDWDMMFLWSILDHVNSFVDYDILVTQEPNHAKSSAYVVKDLDVLMGYLDHLKQELFKKREPRIIDLLEWDVFSIRNNLKVLNLSTPNPYGVWDHNIHVGDETYVFDGETKLVKWNDGFPYFVRKDTGLEVPALLIHCWKTYKHRTAELLSKAGL